MLDFEILKNVENEGERVKAASMKHPVYHLADCKVTKKIN